MDGFFPLGEVDRTDRAFYRVRSAIGRVTLHLGDDSGPYQTHQVEGYPGEIRPNVQRLQHPGLSSMPLPGAKALVSWQGGNRGFGSILAIEDGRYRPTGLQPGETQLYAVDGADGQGNGGTAWAFLQGLLGKICKLLGKTINIGDASSQTIVLTATSQVTISAPTIVLDGVCKLGGADAATPASMQGTVDSAGDSDVSNFATKVLVK